jgi:Fic/DOC family
LLKLAEQEDFCNKARLVDLQNRIVDPRFANADYRTTQNYIGQSVAWQREQVYFACPKPEDLSELMAGLLASRQRMAQSGVDPVVQAAVIAYGFVFLHPFDDGNGRIHRFLVHNILAYRGLTPEGLMFPVSAVMLKSPADYDASLEAFSKQLMPLVEYELDETGQMVVRNDTAIWYRFIEMTAQVEALFTFIEKTIDTELVEELTFLASYDRARSALREIADMPDRQIDLFIRFCLQNDGRLSFRKRTSHFSFLTDDEATQMEQAFQAAYGKAENRE